MLLGFYVSIENSSFLPKPYIKLEQFYSLFGVPLWFLNHTLNTFFKYLVYD